MSGIKQPLTYSGRSRGVDDARTVLLRDASEFAAAGKKPWTVQYFSDSAPIFPGLANGKIDLYFGPTPSLKYDATHVANTNFLGQISTIRSGSSPRRDLRLPRPCRTRSASSSPTATTP